MDDLKKVTHSDNVRLSDAGDAVVYIDQTQLPGRTIYKEAREAKQMYDAIYELQVRGAPCIGIFAAYAACVLAAQIEAEDFDAFYAEFKRRCDYLNSSRPTAVNLSKQLARMERCCLANRAQGREALLEALRAEARAIHQEDIDMCYAISSYGLSLLKDGDGVLTHCNAGPLATSRYGTGQGPFYLAKERGVTLHAYCDETRPLLQGARLTSYELQRAGVDVTLICDNMASMVMKQGKVQACMVGCDRVALNGDAANKIGTSGVAILAKHYGIPFYVLGPSSTIDFTCPTGDDIEIELRDPNEIKEKFFAQPVALDEVKCYNPAFDVTDHSLITAIITERGICYPPFAESFKKLFPEQYKEEDAQ